MRAKCRIENISGGRQAIIVEEIPYQVNKSKLIERIAELVTEGVITDIARDEFRDESDRDGMRIVIGLKRGSEHQIVLNQLHKHTQMQESFSMIFLAVHNGQPKELPLDQAIRAFLDHRIEVVRRRTAFLLAKARDREHILPRLPDRPRPPRRGHPHHPPVRLPPRGPREPLPVLLRPHHQSLRGTELAGVTLDPAKYSIDTRYLPTDAAGAATLILSLKQIDAILELQLYRLTQLSIDELLNELRQIRENIAEYESILASQPNSAPSSSRSSKRSATSTATPAAPSSSTRPPSSASKTSSWTSRSPSPSPTPATSSAPPSPPIASSVAAAPAASA